MSVADVLTGTARGSVIGRWRDGGDGLVEQHILPVQLRLAEAAE